MERVFELLFDYLLLKQEKKEIFIKAQNGKSPHLHQALSELSVLIRDYYFKYKKESSISIAVDAFFADLLQQRVPSFVENRGLFVFEITSEHYDFVMSMMFSMEKEEALFKIEGVWY